MKKFVFACLLSAIAAHGLAQATIVVEAPKNNGSTSGNRAPNGTIAHTYMRGSFLVLASELTGIPANTSLTSFGYTLSSGTAATAVTGNYTLYLQHTNNTTYTKGTNWSTIVTGMTQVYASVLTVPLSAGTTSVMVSLSTPFTYTGGALYVAYDWNSGSPFSTTAAIYLCEATALTIGGASEASTSSAPTTLQNTNFRPSFLFGFANPFTNDMQVLGLSAPGHVATMFNSPHQVTALVKNGSNSPLSAINVSLNVAGANVFSDVHTIPSLPAGASTLIAFSPFNPAANGLNTVVVTVPTDQDPTNNTFSFTQSVTCDAWSQQPATGSYNLLSVGFGTNSGIIGVQYPNPSVTSTLSAIKIAISSNSLTVGQSLYGVLMSATGNTIAITAPKTITSPMLGTFVQFDFQNPPVLSPNTFYYLGGAQTQTGAVDYYPFGTQTSSYLPPNLYAFTGLSGGALTQLVQNFGYFGITGIFSSTIALAVTPQTVSCGNAGTLMATSSTNYSWSTGATTSSIVVSPTVSSVYTVSASNTLGCVASKTVQMNVVPLPVNLTASNDTVCLGKTVSLNASGATFYFWSGGGSGATVTYTPQQTTTYSVTGSILAGCATTKTVMVAVRNFSTVSVAASANTICLGSTVTLTAGGALTYTWSDGNDIGNSAVLVHSPTVSTTYSVTGTNNFSCTNTKTAAIAVIVVPLVVTPDTAVCYGTALTLSASGASGYVWNTGLPYHLLSINSVTIPSTYTVTGTGQNGCKQQAVVNVSVNPSPTVTAKATRSVMCVKESNIITASGADTYSWNTGSTDATITITPTNNVTHSYTVTGSSLNGCTHKTAVHVTVQSCTGIDEIFASGATVFPNPGDGRFTVQLRENVRHTVTIFNGAGMMIDRFETNDDRFTVDLSAQPAGIYTLQFSGVRGKSNARLIRR